MHGHDKKANVESSILLRCTHLGETQPFAVVVYVTFVAIVKE